mgnify:CR=1 FL=1
MRYTKTWNIFISFLSITLIWLAVVLVNRVSPAPYNLMSKNYSAWGLIKSFSLFDVPRSINLWMHITVFFICFHRLRLCCGPKFKNYQEECYETSRSSTKLGVSCVWHDPIVLLWYEMPDSKDEYESKFIPERFSILELLNKIHPGQVMRGT